MSPELVDLLLGNVAISRKFVRQERQHTVGRGKDEVLHARKIHFPLGRVFVRDFDRVFSDEITVKTRSSFNYP